MISNERIATPPEKFAKAAGVLYLLTFVSIPTLTLYSSIHDSNYIVSSGPDTPVFIGGILEIIVALAGIGTAVALYPVLKKQNESIALALVCTRVVEACTMVFRCCVPFFGSDPATIRNRYRRFGHRSCAGRII